MLYSQEVEDNKLNPEDLDEIRNKSVIIKGVYYSGGFTGSDDFTITT